MKKNLLRFVILFSIASIVFEACQKDTQDNTPAPTNSSLDRDKFLGTWTTSSTGSVHGTLNFSMSITAGASSSSQIRMENFDGEGNGTFVYANVSGSSLTISQQQVQNDTTDVISGSGTYNTNNTLSFTYTFSDGQTVDHRTATAHK
jgi:hypothetical protein